MIESIKLSNYKAFENVFIPIKPITIFLGANSVGKSSIIQMLMLMHQTAESKGNSYASALKIYGNYVNAGAYENLFHKKNTNFPVKLSVNIDAGKLGSYVHQCKTEFISIFVQLALYSSYSPVRELIQMSDRLASKDHFTDYIHGLIKEIKQKKSNSVDFVVGNLIGANSTSSSKKYISEIKIEEVLATYELMDALLSETQDTLSITYELIVKDNTLKIRSLDVSVAKSILRIEEDNVSSDYISSRLLDKITILKGFNTSRTIFDCMDDTFIGKNKISPAYYLGKIITKVLQVFNECCSGSLMNYVSPLRAHPKRYYMLDKANTTVSLNTLDGDEITEVLKENATIKRSVNAWFEKFGLKIDVNPFKEVVHNLKVTQNGLALDITDVGFGISQVLPIIIQGFLSSTDSLTIVEQPEIHLHPKMQADLGDLFIDIVKKRSKKIIIETHSEYLLRRIRRRIAEGRISAKDVSICLFHPCTNEHAAYVEVLPIGNKGCFQWPEEFYGGDLYDDTTEYLKYQ